MSISITPSPFGSVTITLDGELGGVLSADILATSNSALNLDLGVPGPQGEQGEQGEAGTNGVGVPVGGTAGQVLAKIDSTNYNTEWITPSSGGGVWGTITGDIVDQTDLYSALESKLSLSGGTMTGPIFTDGSGDYKSFIYNATDGIDPIDAIVQLGSSYFNGNDNAFIGIVSEQYSLGFFGGSGSDLFLKFKDSSVQTTAGLPLTGGTLSGSLSLSGGSEDISLSIQGLSDHTFNFGSEYGLDLQTPNYRLEFNNDFGLKLGTNNNSPSIWLSNSGNGIKFPNNSVQSTAFIPADYYTSSTANTTFYPLSSNPANYLTSSQASATYYPKPTGTSGQYIKGDGTYATYSTGDKYLTTSTTSLSIANGSKTLTIGTGLSYSTQQDVTIAYDASNHMHATVTSYNSTTGVMVCDVYNKTGSGTYSSWTVNVGGVQGGSYLQIANNLSDLNSASTARDNLGLGSMATQSTSAYLSSSAISSTYLTQSSASSTYQTQSGMSAYLSTSAASSTYIAKTSYATTAEAEAMTSTTAVVSPARFRDAYLSANVTIPNTSTWLTGTSGTGGVNDSGTWDNRRVQGPTSAANTYVRCDHGTNQSRGRYYTNNIDWTKYNALYCRIAQSGLNPDTNSIFRAVLGEATGVNTGDPTVRSIGVRFNGQGALKILAHNGTTLTTYTTSYTPSQSVSFDLYLVSDGSGTVEAFVNGTSVGSTTGGPTTLLSGTAAQNCINFRVENNSTPSGTQISTIISGIKAYTS